MLSAAHSQGRYAMNYKLHKELVQIQFCMAQNPTQATFLDTYWITLNHSSLLSQRLHIQGEYFGQT